MKTQSVARRLEFEKSSDENRRRIINLEKSRAVKAVKELQQTSKIGIGVMKNDLSYNPFFDEGLDDEEADVNPFVHDIKDGLNPFDDGNFFIFSTQLFYVKILVLKFSPSA